MYELKKWIPKKNLDWSSLSANPNAISLLEKNLDKINWSRLSENPSIFEFKKKM